MRFSRPSILLASIFQATQVALAFHIELPTRSEAALPNLLARDPNNATSGLVFNSTGGSYYINITLGGQQFSVSIDTGSSDLWVAGTVPNANSTGVSATIPYAVGTDEGPIKTADLTLLGYTVPNQAFVEVTPSSESPEGFGLIGLSPSSGSLVLAALQNNSAGLPPIDRIFQNTSVPDFISVLLSRPNDTREAYTGEMTIGEVLPLFQNISSQPKVPVSVLDSSLSNDQHFSVLLDSDGIIGPNGNAINITSNASLAPSHDSRQLLMAFDTGFALPQLPKYVVDAIYSGAKGAKVVNITVLNGDVWVVDCDVELNISFKIGGSTYPIHPLDVTKPLTDDNGKTFCFGTFQAVIPTADDPTRDGILGTTFLTNVYLLLNYGNFVNGSTSNPYVQILSTTDPAQAHADFVATRSGLSGTTDSPHFNGSGSSKKCSSRTYINTIFAVVAVVLCIL